MAFVLDDVRSWGEAEIICSFRVFRILTQKRLCAGAPCRDRAYGHAEGRASIRAGSPRTSRFSTRSAWSLFLVFVGAPRRWRDVVTPSLGLPGARVAGLCPATPTVLRTVELCFKGRLCR